VTQVQNYDIVGSYNNQRVTSIDAERSVNLFEYIDPLGKKPKVLINTSGLTNTQLLFPGAAGGFRAQFVFDNVEYNVIGNAVFSRTPTNAISFLGTLTTFTGYVGIDANTFEVIFVDGAKGYIWDTNAETFTQITDQSFPTNPIDVCFLDGFFIVASGGTNNFLLSSFDGGNGSTGSAGLVWGPAANNFTADDTVGNNWLVVGSSTIGGASGTQNYETGVPVNVSNSGGALPTPLAASTTYYAIYVDSTHIRLATTYANAIAGTAITLTTNGTGTQTITSLGQLQQGAITTHPGNIVACRTLHRRLFLFSGFYTEVWENAGVGYNLPFRRNNSLLMEYGTPAIGSISVSFDIMVFLSQSRDGLGSVMMVRGTESIPISTRALDFALSQYAQNQQISDCDGFLVKENGLIFYRMNFTAANHTYVYNVTLSDPTNDATKLWHEEEMLDGTRHVAQTHSYFNGINYVGHYNLPILYQLDSQAYTNDGQAIRRMRIAKAFVPPGYQRMRIDRFQVDLLQGNVAEEVTAPVELDLAAENGNFILTENGDDIQLEQSDIVVISGNLQPYAYLSISRDGGQTYGYTIKMPMGQIGQRTFRTVWRKLGTIPRGQAFVPKLEFFDEIPIVILGAAWGMEIMPE
jgi:hypothetical protein